MNVARIGTSGKLGWAVGTRWSAQENNKFATFREAFGSFWDFLNMLGTCLDPFGPVWMRLDGVGAFKCVGMPWEALGRLWKF